MALAGAAMVVASPASPALETERRLATAVDSLLNPLHASDDFNGAVVIGRNGKIVYARGFGRTEIDKGRPLTPDTPVDGASLAKPLTAAAVLALADQGRIDLDAPARRYLPDYPHAATTVRHLLSHSGGLPDYGAFQTMLDSGRPVSTGDLLAEVRARRLPPAFAPGAAFEYCNLCYDALALMVERVSGESYERYLSRRVFGPLSMRTAFLRPARFAEWQGVRTRGYRRAENGWAPNDAFDNEGFHGGGNLYFSARDLHAWVTAFYQDPVFPTRVMRQSVKPALIDGVESGLTLGNWYCADLGRRCYYVGHHQGFHNFAYWDAERRLSVVFISNNTLAAPLQPGLARALVALAEGRAAESLSVSPESDEFDFARAAGAYGRGKARLIFTRQGNRLGLQRDNGLRYNLFPIGSGMLYAPGLDAYISFPTSSRAAYERARWITVFEDFEAVREP